MQTSRTKTNDNARTTQGVQDKIREPFSSTADVTICCCTTVVSRSTGMCVRLVVFDLAATFAEDHVTAVTSGHETKPRERNESLYSRTSTSMPKYWKTENRRIARNTHRVMGMASSARCEEKTAKNKKEARLKYGGRQKCSRALCVSCIWTSISAPFRYMCVFGPSWQCDRDNKHTGQRQIQPSHTFEHPRSRRRKATPDIFFLTSRPSTMLAFFICVHL